MADDLRQCALQCLLITDPLEKVKQTQQLYQRWLAGELSISDLMKLTR